MSQVPDFQECHTLALLLPMGLSRAWIPLWSSSSGAALSQLEAEPGQSQPSLSPRAAEITTTTVGAQSHHCGFLLSTYPFESTGLSSVLLTSQIPYQTVPFYYPEYLLKIFGSRALRTRTVLYVPP